MFGNGGVDQNQDPGPIINRWDYVRYGRVTAGEAIVASDPPNGVLDAAEYPGLDRFTVTFDQPNYVYVADITVEVLPNQYRNPQGAVLPDSVVPTVIATRRQDNGPPETVEIVLDRPLTVADGTVRFTFNTDGTPNIVEYTLVDASPCCLPNGACLETTPAECSAQGGNHASAVCEGDLDADGRDAQCDDQCPTDSLKIAPGQCGCGASDTDTDSDTIADCLDQCPGDDDRVDANSNEIPDCLESTEIPTASVWGLVVLALLLTIASKIFHRIRLVA